ncbi:MAG: sugar ABC transporter substrate-binding protein [Solobacterium sp.]|nr:sugar ABC transporter substrate-binding protein [Solobacterium sp.]
MEKMIKRGLAAAMTAFMAFSVAACSGGGGSPSNEPAPAAPEDVGELVAEEGAEIEIAYWEGSTSDKAAWDEVIANLQKDHPEIKIVPQTYPSGDFRDMLDTRIAGDDWPDVIRYTYQRLGKFKAADVMLDLTPYMEQSDLDDFADGFLSGCSYNGKVVALPHHTDVVVMFYNKRMFEEAGIRIPTSMADAYTWEEIAEIAQTLKDKYKLPYGFAGIWENGSGYRYLPFMYMNGGALLSEDQTTVTIDSAAAREAIQYYADLRAKDLVANTAFTASSTANSLFVAEQIAFDFAGSWHCSYMEENMPGNWGVTYMPQRNGKTGTDMGGNGIWCYKKTKYPKAAAIVAQYITSQENMRKFCETGNFIPVRESLLSGGLNYKSFPEQMAIFNESALTIDAKMAADETSVPFQQLNLIFNEEMDPLVVNGSATVDDVINNCMQRMQEVLDEQ